MIIQLKGVGTVNKGAYLMLLSIMEHFEKNHPEKRLTFVTNFASNFSRREGKELGVRRLLITKRRNIEFRPFLRLLPFALRKRADLFIENDVDVILDASGFAYGDQWSVKGVRYKMSNSIERWKSQNKKVVLLPQAFGPFKNRELRLEMEKIVQHADLIFARDPISYQYLRESFGDRENIRQAPDFTNLLDSATRKSSDKRVLLIPNFKLIDKTAITRIKLVTEFKRIIEQVRLLGKEPELLVHEGKRDEQIAQEINEALESEVPIIIEKDARKQKEIIGSAYAVITGRFHGLVSALSQGIPSIAFSWSHKYEMLLADYQQQRFLFKPDSPENELLVKELLDDEKNSDIRKALKAQGEIQRKRSIDMWKAVDKLIFSDSPKA